MSQTTFCFACHRGDSLSAWLEGTQTARANNATSRRSAAPSPCLSKATHLLLSCGARERDKEREREIFISYFKHCQVTLFLHYVRASASPTLGGFSEMYKLVMFTWIHEHYRNPIPLSRSIPPVHCRVRGLRNLKYYFLKSWGKCRWIRLMFVRFLLSTLPVQCAATSSTSHVLSWHTAGAHACISAAQPHQNIYRFFTRCIQICQIHAGQHTHTHTHTHTHISQTNYTQALTRIQFTPHAACAFSRIIV